MLRLFRIALEVVRFSLGNAARRLHLLPAEPSSPERLCLAFARLGTTFIKFGQALSMRRDMLPDDYVNALQSLQDHISPFSAVQTISEVERGLQRPMEQLFVQFDRDALAAASVAQVHTARMHDGRDVIVKVRRTNIKVGIDRDMRALTLLARIVVLFAPRFKHYQPLRVIDEIWNNLRKEIDFRQEARNIRHFHKAFAEWPTIHIPKVVDDLVSETVIVQERSGGRRIDDPEITADGPRLAQNFVDAYLHQIFVLGAFHGDPHPGNLFITPEGRICFHDFGLVGFLDSAARRKLAGFTNAFVRQDADWLLSAAIDLGVLGGDMNRNQFRQGLAEIIADFAARPVKDWSLAEAFVRVTRVGQAENVLVPYDLLVLMRAMFNAEHVVRTLDPEFQLLENLQERAPKVLKTAMEHSDWRAALDRARHDAWLAVHDLPTLLGSLAHKLSPDGEGLTLGLRIRELDGVKEHVARSINRLALALVIVGLYVSGSLLLQHSIGPRIYGDIPIFAAAAFTIALLLSYRLVRGISRSGRL